MSTPQRPTRPAGPRRPPGFRTEAPEEEAAKRLAQEFAEDLRQKLMLQEKEKKKPAVKPEDVSEEDLEQKKPAQATSPIPEKEKTAPTSGLIREEKVSGSRSGSALTMHVLASLAKDGGARRIKWEKPYCTRGWIRSLNPTVIITAKVQCDGETYTIGQNAHRDGFGSAWIKDKDGSDVNPAYLPEKWVEGVRADLEKATEFPEFAQEVTFSRYLEGKGARGLGQGDHWSDAVKNRWLTLRANYSTAAVGKAPGGAEALERLKLEGGRSGGDLDLNAE